MQPLRITLHFLTLEVFSHSETINTWIKSYYKSFDQSERFVDRGQLYTIHIEEIDSEHELDIKTVDSVFAKFCLLNTHCYYNNGVFSSSSAVHRIEVDTVARRVKINLKGDLVTSEETFIYNVMRDLLGKVILPLCGLVTLHASVVVRDRIAICFSGDKGMGKSTLALKLMQNGFSVLSDDSPLFASMNGNAYALSSLDELSVTENTLKLFSELVNCVGRQRDVSGKYFVSRSLLDDDKLAYGPAVLTHFIQLDRRDTEGKAILEPKDRTLVAAEILRETMSLFPNSWHHPLPRFFEKANQMQFETLSQIVADAKCFSLSYSNNHFDEIPQLIDQCLLAVSPK